MLASYFTIAGNVPPTAADTSSPWSFADRVAAAADAGYVGVGIRAADLAVVRADIGLQEMKRILDDHDMRYIELDVLTDWFATGERRSASDAVRKELLEAADVLGPYHIKITGDRVGQDWPLEVYVEAFEQLCRDAEKSGTLIALEVIPMTGIPDLQSGLAVVSEAGASNGGLCIDIWHMERGGVPFTEIAATPPEYVKYVEIGDAPPGPATWEDTFMNRTLCGEGSFDIPGFVTAIRSTGYQGPVGMEIIGEAHRQRDLRTAAELSFSAALPYLATE